MKECGFCGTELPDNARFCSRCGNEFDLETGGAPYLIGPPPWGAVRISKLDPDAAPDLLNHARDVWRSLEKVGQLGLFMGQASRPLSSNSVLYCPINSYANLLKAFADKEPKIVFTFTPVTSDELDEIIKSYRNESPRVS